MARTRMWCLSLLAPGLMGRAALRGHVEGRLRLVGVGRQSQPDRPDGDHGVAGRQRLCAQAHHPLGLGADEEASGERGAKQIAAPSKSRGERLDFVIDEGLLITEGVMPGLDKRRLWWALRRRGTCRW